MEEGQAVYINKLFTKNKEIGVHSQNLHQRAKLIIQDDALKGVLSFDNAYANYHLKGEFELRHAFYYVSGSLVQYIAETYGKEAMLTIYQTEEVSEVIGLSFEELKQEWISYLETLEKKDVNK